MIGRAAIGYPWIFNEIKHFFKTGEHLPPPTIEERVSVAVNIFTGVLNGKDLLLGSMKCEGTMRII